MRTLTENELSAISGAGQYADSWSLYGSYVGNGVGSIMGWLAAGKIFDNFAPGGFMTRATGYALGAFTLTSCGAAGLALGHIVGNISGLTVDAFVYLQNREKKY